MDLTAAGGVAEWQSHPETSKGVSKGRSIPDSERLGPSEDQIEEDMDILRAEELKINTLWMSTDCVSGAQSKGKSIIGKEDSSKWSSNQRNSGARISNEILDLSGRRLCQWVESKRRSSCEGEDLNNICHEEKVEPKDRMCNEILELGGGKLCKWVKSKKSEGAESDDRCYDEKAAPTERFPYEILKLGRRTLYELVEPRGSSNNSDRAESEKLSLEEGGGIRKIIQAEIVEMGRRRLGEWVESRGRTQDQRRDSRGVGLSEEAETVNEAEPVLWADLLSAAGRGALEAAGVTQRGNGTKMKAVQKVAAIASSPLSITTVAMAVGGAMREGRKALHKHKNTRLR